MYGEDWCSRESGSWSWGRRSDQYLQIRGLLRGLSADVRLGARWGGLSGYVRGS